MDESGVWLSEYEGIDQVAGAAFQIAEHVPAWLGKVWANRILEQDRAKYQIQIDTLLKDLPAQG